MSDNTPTPFITRSMLSLGSGVQFVLRVSSATNYAGDFTIRGMTSYGQFTFHHTGDGTSGIKTEDFGLPDVPIFVMAYDEGKAFDQGDAWISLDLIANGDLLYQLASGFVYVAKKVSYPPVSGVDMRPGGGGVWTILGTDPAAGVLIDEQIPVNQLWKFQAVTFTLVTDANVADRYVQFTQLDATKTYLVIPAAAKQTAGTTVRYTFAPGLAIVNDSVNLIQTIGVPNELWFYSGVELKINIVNKQAGDNLSAPVINVEKFFVSF